MNNSDFISIWTWLPKRNREEDIMFSFLFLFWGEEGNKLEISSSAISQKQFNSDITVHKSSITSNDKIDS